LQFVVRKPQKRCFAVVVFLYLINFKFSKMRASKKIDIFQFIVEIF